MYEPKHILLFAKKEKTDPDVPNHKGEWFYHPDS